MQTHTQKLNYCDINQTGCNYLNRIKKHRHAVLTHVGWHAGLKKHKGASEDVKATMVQFLWGGGGVQTFVDFNKLVNVLFSDN